MIDTKDKKLEVFTDCLFIVGPTLDQLIRGLPSVKDGAFRANMEISNYRKACRMYSNIRIQTLARCAFSMDREVLILLLPKGTVASSGMEVVTHPRKWFSVIQQQNLIEILHTLCKQDILRAKNTLKVELCKAIDNLESFNSGLLVELIKTIREYER